MMRRLPLLLVCVLSAAGAVEAQTPPEQLARPTVTAVRLGDDESITLDGRLDEPVWRRAIPAAGFKQQIPQTGAPPTEPTEVRFAFTRDALYMGVTCFDDEPGKLLGNTMKRDEGLGADDRFIWEFDTFLDARNGYYFLLDRTNGKSIQTVPYVDFMNWSLGVNDKGQPINNPAKDATVDGTLVSPGSATNWPPPSFSPKTGLLYVGTSQSYGLQYLTDTDERPEGYGGGAVGGGGAGGREAYIKALDYRTGKVRWRHALTEGGAMGLLTTAGDLLFGGDGSANFVAYDPSTGDPLWHAGLHATPSNAPITFMLDVRQFVVIGAGDSLYAFTLAR